MNPGIDIELSGTTYTVPPIALGDLERMQDALENYTGKLDAAGIKTVIDATYAALKRNYPELTRDSVANLIDVGNMGDVMEAVMDASGMRRKEIAARKAAAASA